MIILLIIIIVIVALWFSTREKQQFRASDKVIDFVAGKPILKDVK